MKVVHWCHIYNYLLRETLNESVNLSSKLPQNSVPIFISRNRIYFQNEKNPVYTQNSCIYGGLLALYFRKKIENIIVSSKRNRHPFTSLRILFSSLSINLNLYFFLELRQEFKNLLSVKKESTYIFHSKYTSNFNVLP